MKYSQELYPFRSRWINVSGHKIHYVDEGEGEVILFSHAALGSSFMYRWFIQFLSKKYRCIALDFPGFGLSTDNPDLDYGIESQAEILWRFIEELQLTELIAFGHDTGGPSVFKVATEHPELFKGLILTDTLIFPTKEYPRIHKMLGMIGSKVFQTLNAYTNLLVKLTLSKGIITRDLAKKEKQQYNDLFRSRGKRRRITQLLHSLRSNQNFMQELYNGFKDHLKSKCTLMIYGEQDPVTKLGIPHRIHAMLQNSELFFILNEGHFPHEGQPERMCEIISEWIDNVLSTKATSTSAPVN